MSRESLERYWASVPRYKSWQQIVKEEQMKCAVVKSEKFANGQVKRIESVEIRDLTPIQAENLSEIAAIVSLEGVGVGGSVVVYEDRVAKQALMTAEQREMLETLALECAHRRAQYDGRNGWIS